MQIFLDSLYSFYSRSPKNQCQIKEIATELEEDFLSVGKIFDVRWSSSSFRALHALWKNYTSLVEHLQRCSLDGQRNSKEQSKCSGLMKKMVNWSFVGQMAMLKDGLRVVKDLSLFLQRESASIMVAPTKVKLAVKLLAAMKEKDGKSVHRFMEESVQSNSFKGISLHGSESEKEHFLTCKKNFFSGAG